MVPLLVLAGFSVVGVAGYVVFGRDPSRLGGLSALGARFYAISFSFFSQGQVVLAGTVLLLELWRRTGWRWAGPFALVYAVSLGSELMGTAFGVPFGPYSYTDLLGPKWLGLVPVLIPLSWFSMAVPSYVLVLRALGPGSGAGSRILLGSLLLLAWDLSLDPAMSAVTRYWVWAERGPYYGMPLMNLAGWYVTGLALLGILEWRARSWLAAVPGRWVAAFYGANLILPFGLSVAAGLWGAVVATAGVLAGFAAWAAWRSGPHRPGRAGAERAPEAVQ